MEEKKQGGKRIGSGRKPLDDNEKKEQITLFVKKGKTYKFGGKEKLKVAVMDFINNYEPIPKIKDLTQPTNQLQPEIQPQTNFEVNTQAKKKTPQEWIADKREIEDWDKDGYKAWISKLDACSYLTDRQKREIKFA